MEFSHLTHGFLIPQRKYKKLLIDPRIQKMDPAMPNVLVVYSVGKDFMRITAYPVKGSKVWKIQICLQACNPEIVEKIGSQLKEYPLIHTTGLCEKANSVMIEEYFNLNCPIGEFERVINELRKAPGIDHIEIQSITLK